MLDINIKHYFLKNKETNKVWNINTSINSPLSVTAWRPERLGGVWGWPGAGGSLGLTWYWGPVLSKSSHTATMSADVQFSINCRRHNSVSIFQVLFFFFTCIIFCRTSIICIHFNHTFSWFLQVDLSELHVRQFLDDNFFQTASPVQNGCHNYETILQSRFKRNAQELRRNTNGYEIKPNKEINKW